MAISPKTVRMLVKRFGEKGVKIANSLKTKGKIAGAVAGAGVVGYAVGKKKKKASSKGIPYRRIK